MIATHTPLSLRGWLRAGFAAAAVIVMAGLTAPAANSAIECQGQFQVVDGQGLISTPYCQDRNLYHVSREYGMKYSFQAIRHNPSIKQEVCRAIGHDNRVYNACTGFRDDFGRDRRF